MKKRYLYWWVSFALGYIFPFTYFAIKLGITKQAKSIVMPVVILGIVAVLELCKAIPEWISTWRPCFLKGFLKSIPIYLLFACMITFGLVLKYLLENSIVISLNLYFEVVLVVFGSLCVSSVFKALHQKYKELDLLSKGYTLGVVNRHGK